MPSLQMIEAFGRRREWAAIRLYGDSIRRSQNALMLYWLGRAYKAEPQTVEDYRLAALASAEAARLAVPGSELWARALANTVTPWLFIGALSKARSAIDAFFTQATLDAGAQALAPHYQYKRGELAAATGRFAEAVLAFRAVLPMTAGEARLERLEQQARMAIATCELSRGNLEGASSALDLRLWPTLPQPCVLPLYLANKAAEWEKRNHLRKARRCARMAVAGLAIPDEWNRDNGNLGSMYALLCRIAVASGNRLEAREHAANLFRVAIAVPRPEWLELASGILSAGSGGERDDEVFDGVAAGCDGG